MSQHTPGPWIASHRHVHGSADDDEMAGLGWDIEGPPEPMLRGQFAKAADARLAAAAPDLLAAAEWALAYVDSTAIPDDEQEHADALATAIAKARGVAS